MKAFILSLLLMHSMSASSQVIFDNVEEVLALGRDSVINLAISHLERSGFTNIDLNQFDRLVTQTNGQEVKVIFDKSIQYVPRDTFIVHTAAVNIIRMSVGWEPYGTKTSDTKFKQFYEYTAEDKKAIDFALFGRLDIKDTRIIIHEYENYYSVKKESYSNGYSGEAGYKVDKLSGKKSDQWHMNLGIKNIGDGYKNIEW